MTKQEYESLVKIAQTVLRTWNAGQGFGREYFQTKKGKAIISNLHERLKIEREAEESTVPLQTPGK